MEAWHAAGRREARTELTPDPARLADLVLDVRQADEFVGGHVPGARLVELGSLGPVIAAFRSDVGGVMCGHGERAMSAASLLERAGGSARVFLGGPADWSRAAGRALVKGR